MILKKPYAFFIKVFKPIHLLMTLSILYSITMSSRILNFLNNYLHSSSSVVGQQIRSLYVNNFFYIIPISIILLSMLMLGIMFKKGKPVVLYFISIFSFISILIINVYTSNFLSLMETAIISITSIKLIHDLTLINIVIQSVILIFYLMRGMGINLKKFDFDSDISKFEISESDKEEFEININIDFDESKRRRKEKLRNLKYTYVENKFLINLSTFIFVLLVIFISAYLFLIRNSNKKVQGELYSMSSFSIGVDSTIILEDDYQGRRISPLDSSLVVVSIRLGSSAKEQFLHLKNFNLDIGGTKFKATNNYSSKLIDIGNTYNENILTSEPDNYLIVFEVPNKFINSKMVLTYNGLDYSIDIILNPTNLKVSSNSINYNIGDEISFEDTIGYIKIKINSFEIADKFLINYNYCITTNDCISSKEYLKPSIDTNFDKYILKLDLEYSNNSKLNLPTFYNFFDKFGIISYKIGETWYTQSSSFEEIKSKRISSKNTEYIGINSKIAAASEIKLIFNIRSSRYEYTLKGEI